VLQQVHEADWHPMVAALLQILPALAVGLINLQYYLMVQAMAVFG